MLCVHWQGSEHQGFNQQYTHLGQDRRNATIG